MQEILIPLKVLAGSDQYLSDTLSTFIKSQQESIYCRRRESNDGRVLAAIIQLHEEGAVLTGSAVSLRVKELDDDAEMTAIKAGLIAKRLGFIKSRIPKDGRHVVVWDEMLAIRLALHHGLPMPSYISHENPSQVSQVSRLSLYLGVTGVTLVTTLRGDVKRKYTAPKNVIAKGRRPCGNLSRRSGRGNPFRVGAGF